MPRNTRGFGTQNTRVLWGQKKNWKIDWLLNETGDKMKGSKEVLTESREQ